MITIRVINKGKPNENIFATDLKDISTLNISSGGITVEENGDITYWLYDTPARIDKVRLGCMTDRLIIVGKYYDSIDPYPYKHIASEKSETVWRCS